ncbi:MAG: hypothetical protein WD010_00715 [Nitriliruptor sp.]|uniref:hypothetical protein n=1 Tax=Nitriliruptor sp. TaxID=2448056 RepID=UPI0034A03851
MDPTDPSPGDPPDRVVIHASLRGLAAGMVTPVALLLLGGAALLAGGLRPFPALLAFVGAVLAIVVLADLPRRVEFDATGITRVCWVRRQHLTWDEVATIERTRPGTATRTRNLVDRREGREPFVAGGLVARGRGKRRWLLTDRVESRAEHDRLAALVTALGASVTLRAARPHQAAPPTDLYRRHAR